MCLGQKTSRAVRFSFWLVHSLYESVKFYFQVFHKCSLLCETETFASLKLSRNALRRKMLVSNFPLLLVMSLFRLEIEFVSAILLCLATRSIGRNWKSFLLTFEKRVLETAFRGRSQWWWKGRQTLTAGPPLQSFRILWILNQFFKYLNLSTSWLRTWN